MKKYNLMENKVKRYKLSRNNQEKPIKYKLVNPQILSTINNSECYTSSFDNPNKSRLKLDDLVYRMSDEQKEKWINFIINDDPRILKIKVNRNTVTLVLKNTTFNGIRYMSFIDQRKFLLEGVSNVTTRSKKKEKQEARLNNVSSKPRIKRRNKKKNKRK